MSADKCPPVGTYVRHLKTGDLAQIIEKDGLKWIKPDIPGSPVLYPAGTIYNWQVEQHARRLPPGSFAKVAYDSWKSLCDVHPDLKRQKEWIALHPNVKAEWIEGRHKFGTKIEELLYKAIVMVLEENTE